MACREFLRKLEFRALIKLPPRQCPGSGRVPKIESPSNRILAIYYGFLSRISHSCCRHIIIIGDNHDSPTLLNLLRVSSLKGWFFIPTNDSLFLDKGFGTLTKKLPNLHWKHFSGFVPKTNSLKSSRGTGTTAASWIPVW
ncbi:MAG TPA: hypothetical protein EYH19_00995 [Desulfocapsa sulfexigens]|nr:hypothetical protein [Desulfocapsa sulfexigens]